MLNAFFFPVDSRKTDETSKQTTPNFDHLTHWIIDSLSNKY